MYYKKCKITKVIKNGFNNYKLKYIITINGDVLDFADSIKESKNIINEFLKEL